MNTPRVIPGRDGAAAKPIPPQPVPIIGCEHEQYTMHTKGGTLPNGQRQIQIAVRCAACGAPYRFVALPFGGGAATVFRSDVLTVIAEVGEQLNQVQQGEATCKPPQPSQS